MEHEQALFGKIGECIWYCDNMGEMCDQKALDAVKSWYDEIKDYSFYSGKSTGGCITHFSQVVWDSTNKLGMGMATANNKVFVVGRYTPNGNWDEFTKHVHELK